MSSQPWGGRHRHGVPRYLVVTDLEVVPLPLLYLETVLELLVQVEGAGGLKQAVREVDFRLYLGCVEADDELTGLENCKDLKVSS